MIVAPPPAMLEVYYAPSCAPCRLELPALAEFARTDPTRLHIVIVNEESLARETLIAASPRLGAAAASSPVSNARALLRAAGDADGMLPYARALTPSGRICARWFGILTHDRLRTLLNSCSRAVTEPRWRRS